MKKLFISVIAIAAITFVGCEEDDSAVESPKDALNIINLRSAGKVVKEAKYNLANCKPEKSKETLESFRFVGPLPLYYMDYAADVDWNKLLSDSDNRIIRSYSYIIIINFSIFKGMICSITFCHMV